MLRARDALERDDRQSSRWATARPTGTSARIRSNSSRNWDFSTIPASWPTTAATSFCADGAPTGVVEIPVDWVRDDAVYLLFNREPPTRPWTPPEAVFDIFRREFDAAFDEGGVCQLVFHPFVIGYRSRIWILDQLIAHARSRGHVWFPTHRRACVLGRRTPSLTQPACASRT